MSKDGCAIRAADLIALTHLEIDMWVIIGRRRSDAGELPRTNFYLANTQIVLELRVATRHCLVSRNTYFPVVTLAFDAAPEGLTTPPQVIEIADGGFQVEASVIAAGLDIETDRVLVLLRSGEITSKSERGVGEDAGFHRLTFYYGNQRFRVIIDGTGRIVRGSTVNFGALGRPR